MKITILCVGKIKEKYYTDAVAEYARRLSRYCRFEVVEVADEMTPDGASAAQNEQIREREGKRLLAKLKEDDYVISLEIGGKKLTSEAFAREINHFFVSGISSLTFVIGGSLGLHENVVKRADYHLSFSDMTFPHQLMRVILSEQIYRAFRILNHEPYHK